MSAPLPANFNAEEADNFEDVSILLLSRLDHKFPCTLLILIYLQIEKQFAVKGSQNSKPSNLWATPH